MNFKPLFHFLEELKRNNSRDWFKSNKSTYERDVKKPFEDLVHDILLQIATMDKDFSDLEVKNCIFRIHRDVRFSKNKDPYKVHMSALITPFGKKGMSDKGFYFEMGVENIRFYAGMYQPSKEEVYNIREAIGNELGTFKKLYTDTTFIKTFQEIRGEKNKRISPEFKDQSDKEPLLFNKQWYIFKDFSREETSESQFVNTLLETYRISLPLQNFLQTNRL